METSFTFTPTDTAQIGAPQDYMGTTIRYLGDLILFECSLLYFCMGIILSFVVNFIQTFFYVSLMNGNIRFCCVPSHAVRYHLLVYSGQHIFSNSINNFFSAYILNNILSPTFVATIFFIFLPFHLMVHITVTASCLAHRVHQVNIIYFP